MTLDGVAGLFATRKMVLPSWVSRGSGDAPEWSQIKMCGLKLESLIV